MSGKIKNALPAAILALFATGAQAAAYTYEDVKEYAEEMPELSYQPEAIDCEIAGKMAAKGAWLVLNEKYPHSSEWLAMEAKFEVLKIGMDGYNGEYVDKENPRKGIEEILDTYKGFFINGAAEANVTTIKKEGDKYKIWRDGKGAKNASLKEKRILATKYHYHYGKHYCEEAKKDGTLKEFIARTKLAGNEF